MWYRLSFCLFPVIIELPCLSVIVTVLFPNVAMYPSSSSIGMESRLHGMFFTISALPPGVVSVAV